MLYISFIVTIKEELVVNTQKIKRNEFKHTTKESHESKLIKTREERNRETTKQLEMNHFCWSQWCKTRNQLQEENWKKKHIYVEIK